MKIAFQKYQGAGNDFVMIDQRENCFLTRENTDIIEKLCNRRFGIGADGLILLEKGQNEADFEMVYFNADGREGSMCGNGGRCTVAFAFNLGAIGNNTVFDAVDGAHLARVTRPDWVELQMIDVEQVEIGQDYYLMNTGSPHFVVFVEDINDINVYEAGREIRYSERFRTEGVNVNFVQVLSDEHIFVATYERGVEDETLACGTGVTAAAIAYFLKAAKTNKVKITTKGGNLGVHFDAVIQDEKVRFSNVWLSGGANKVFDGEIEL